MDISDMNIVNLKLNCIHKSIKDDAVLEKVIYLSGYYSLDLTEISKMLTIFIIKKSITEESITMETIEHFEKDTLKSRSTSDVLPDLNTKSRTTKKKLNINIFDEYEIDDSAENNNDSQMDTYEPVNPPVKELSDYDMDESSEDIDNDSQWPVTVLTRDDNYQYMYQQSTQILEVFEKHGMQLFQERLAKRNEALVDESNHIHLNETSAVDNTDQEVYICGTIVADHTHASVEHNPSDDCADPISLASVKLTTENIAIQGLSSIKCAVVPLNLTQMKSYSFFPGQHVILKGQNSSKLGFTVNEILPNHFNSPAPIAVDEVIGNLRILIASGPFSLKDSDDFRLLEQIMSKLTEEKSNVLILIGPFVDEDNEAIQTRSETELYSTMLEERLLNIAKRCIALNVQVVFVPSVKDIGHTDTVFPQPRFDILSEHKEFQNSLVHFAPNPGFMNIGPLSFAVTSVDILRHMKLQELERKNDTRSIQRLCQHILSENNLYPLTPASHEVSIDWLMWPHCHLGRTHTPHCVIMPSKLNTFAEDVGGVLCINPGLVVTNNYRGTFATLTLTAAHMKQGASTIAPATLCHFNRL